MEKFAAGLPLRCSQPLRVQVEWLRRVIAPLRKDIYRNCRLERLRKGDVLFEQGDEGKAFYIILAGMVNVNVRVEDCTKLEDINMVRRGTPSSRPALAHFSIAQIKHIFDKGDAATLNSNGQHTVNTLGPMQWFGGMALGAEDTTRMASIVAIENTLLMAVPRRDYEAAVVRAVVWCEVVRTVSPLTPPWFLQRAYEAEKSITALQTLRETPYFRHCPPQALKRLAAASSIHEHAAGELVVAQNDPAHSLIIVIEGSLHVYARWRIGMACGPRNGGAVLTFTMRAQVPATPPAEGAAPGPVRCGRRATDTQARSAEPAGRAEDCRVREPRYAGNRNHPESAPQVPVHSESSHTLPRAVGAPQRRQCTVRCRPGRVKVCQKAIPHAPSRRRQRLAPSEPAAQLVGDCVQQHGRFVAGLTSILLVCWCSGTYLRSGS